MSKGGLIIVIVCLLVAGAVSATPVSLRYRVEVDGQPVGESGETTQSRGTHLITATWSRGHLKSPIPIDFDERVTYDESRDGRLLHAHSEYRENELRSSKDITVGADQMVRIQNSPSDAPQLVRLDAKEQLLGPLGIRRVIARWLKDPTAQLSFVTIDLLMPTHVSLEDLGAGALPGSRLVRERWLENGQVWERLVNPDGTTLETRTDGPSGRMITRLVP